MRLLQLQNDGDFSLTTNLLDDDLPRYAILSHTWEDDSEEVTFEDLVGNSGKGKAGYRKLQFCGKQAARDDLQYFWVDSCCIKKSSDAELSEAIISMFRWYRGAAKCYVYLSDVSIWDATMDDESSHFKWEQAFRKSRWFTRGWTLQELLAPASVEFFSSEGQRLGNKDSLKQQLHEITGIPVRALQGSPLSDFSIAERISWAEKRETTREEDKVYSLLGIFDVYMPLLYREGRENAFKRLKKKIGRLPKGKYTNSG